MKRALVLCLALLPLLAAAQAQKPEWIDAGQRRGLYPDATFFTGFASGFVRQDETVEAATARLKADAQGDAAQRIEVYVQSEALNSVQSVQHKTAEGLDEDIKRMFSKQTYASSSMEIPNLQVLTWCDPTTREAAVMVYTKRRDFMRYYDRQIESLLGRMEAALDNVAQLESQGAQMKGRAAAEEALELSPQVEYAQRMVAIADAEASLEDLQMTRYTELLKRLAATIARLRHATTFYVRCDATIGGSAYAMLDKEVRGLLAARGCNFTDEAEGADWRIVAEAGVINTQHMDGMPYFVYVDGTLTVENGATGKRVLEDRLSQLEPGHPDGIKGGEYKPDKAARIAYSETARIVAEAVMRILQE